jgi:hypothetical protein
VLDTVNGAVKEFDETGRFSREFLFPPVDERDVPTLAVDMVQPEIGKYWLLCLGPRALLWMRDSVVQCFQAIETSPASALACK